MNTHELPLVSVLMPVFNNQNTIDAAVASILNQSYANWELLVMDDGSTDGTAERLARHRDPRVRFFPDSTRLGVAGRLNRGLVQCRGKYIARMDADDIAFPDRLQKQVYFMEANPGTDLLGTSILYINDQLQAFGRLICPPTHDALCSRLHAGIPLHHPTWLARRNWLQQWKYNQVLFKYAPEDFDLLMRSFQSSRFACLPEPLLGYRFSFSPRKVLTNGFLMIFLLFKNKFRRAAARMLLYFIPRTLVFCIMWVLGPRISEKIVARKASLQPAEKTEWEKIRQLTLATLACQSHQKP